MGRIAGAMIGGLLYDGMQRFQPGWGLAEGGIFFVSAASPSAISTGVNGESAALILVGFFIGTLGRRADIETLLIAGTVSAIISLIIYIVSPSLEFIYAASVFKGLSDGLIASSSYAFASVLISPRKRGRYFAIYNSTFFLS